VCYGFFGTSRFAIVSATSSSAAVLAAATTSLAPADAGLRLMLAAGLVLLTGAFFVVAWAARLGTMSEFVAKPVLRGFAFGLALVIMARQLPHLLGVQAQHADVFRLVLDLTQQFPTWNVASVLTGLVSLGLLLGLRRFQGVPAALVVIALSVSVQMLVHLDQWGVHLVGPIDVALHAPALPGLSKTEWFRLGELAFALLFVLYAESYGSVRSFALKHAQAISADRELLALGISNLVSGLLGGMTVGAGYSATSANEAAGARSRRAAWVAAAVVLVVVLTLLPLVALTPQPVLAAVVMVAVSHAVKLDTLAVYFRWQRDRVVVLVAVAAVLLLGVLDGLLAAVGASLLMTLRDLSIPKVSQLGRMGQGHAFVSLSLHPEARRVPGLLIMRPEAALFFGNADRMLAMVRHRLKNSLVVNAQGVFPDNKPIHTLILSLEESPDLDGSSVESLMELARFCQTCGTRLVVARVHGPVREVLTRADIPGLPASAMTHWSVDDAVGQALFIKPPITSQL
jgi:MFS superfamily sulfate permease-like transporter